MKMLSGLLDRLLLLLAVLAAGALPSFVQQYIQRLGGRLAQVELDLAPWRDIANRMFGGDLQRLIQHHLDSGDAVFIAEAAAIDAMRASERELQAALAAMQGDLPQRIYGWATHVNWSDAEATWRLYEPQFPLDPQGLVFALVVGGALWLLTVGTAAGCGSAVRRRQRRRRERRAPPPVIERAR